MSTKAYQGRVTTRLKTLINEAGGQTAFARRVWGDPHPHKGKVQKWYRGHSGIRPDEAVKVAESFGRRPAWLLLGELPERAGVARADVTLAADLAAYVANEAIAKANPGMAREAVAKLSTESTANGVIASGDTLLQLLVDEAASDWRANARHNRDKLAAFWDVATLRNAKGKVDLDALNKVVNRIVAASAPRGRIVSWDAVSKLFPKEQKARRRSV
jgi:hypothetical protein